MKRVSINMNVGGLCSRLWSPLVLCLVGTARSYLRSISRFPQSLCTDFPSGWTSFTIPTTEDKSSPFPTPSIAFVDDSHSDEISRQFWFEFIWYREMMNSFKMIYCLVAFLLLRTICSDHWPIYKLEIVLGWVSFFYPQSLIYFRYKLLV